MSEQVHYFFDESGEKGFISTEPDKKSFGMIAGVATLPSRNISTLETKFNDIFDEIVKGDIQKLHATEIFKDGQNLDVKEKFLQLIANESELLIVYEAIYAKGFYENKKSLEKITSSQPPHPHIKYASNKKRDRLYNLMFKGIVIKLDEICKIEESENLIMITDRLDKKLLEENEAALAHLKRSEHTSTTKAFDIRTKEKLAYNITFKPEIDISVQHIQSVTMEEIPSYFTLAADIICNSIYRHLNRKIEAGELPRLNSDTVMKDFDLYKKIALLDDEHIWDNIYGVQ